MSSTEGTLRNRRSRAKLYRLVDGAVVILAGGLLLSGLFAGKTRLHVLGAALLLLTVVPSYFVFLLEARVEGRPPSTPVQWARILAIPVFTLGFGLWSLGYALDLLWLEIAALPIWLGGVIAQLTSSPPGGKKRESTP